MTRRRVGVLISGRGSNLAALIAAAQSPDYPAEIAVVVSNRQDAAGLRHADAAHVATRIVPHRDFANREAFDRAVGQVLQAARCDLVCCAGFMRILTPWFIGAWRGRLLNIHPSLLPSFPGLEPHRQAIEAGVRISGCTVHFVDEGVDRGPIVAQAAVPVMANDTPATLAERVLTAEHRLYPASVALVASGGAWLEGDRVMVRAGGHGDAILLSSG